MARCTKLIGGKDRQSPCGLPVHKDDLCQIHWLARENAERRWAKKVRSDPRHAR